MAYPEALTAALGGVTVHQLRRWRSGPTPLLAPETSATRPILYSFRDLIAIRTVAKLRTDFSLQKIRRALANLQDLTDVEHLAHHRLIGDGRDTIVWATEGEQVDILRRPGQRLLVTMQDVLGEFEGWTGATIVPLQRPKAGIEIDPDVLQGFPVIEHTRIPYDTVSGLVADGLGVADIRYFYPSVNEAGVTGAVEFDRYVRTYNRRDAHKRTA
ncbi:DUF433 domain-containing protein [Micromonospora okii]|uniref:DUF433 domain-containing protein n=1 Tax=Micromonospora okii TaxID=1182970 RepID=UPI001E5A663E|nr:DUF433 domain-containing protein [Micromonospora okii]